MSIDVLLSGHAARQAYRNGVIDTSMPLERLEARSHVNEAALGLRTQTPTSRTRSASTFLSPPGGPADEAV